MSADAHEKPGIFAPADVVADLGDASATWRRALQELLSDKQRFDSWRTQRYAFAHRVGTLLTEAHPPTPAATGPRSTASTSREPVFATWDKPRRPDEGYGTFQSGRAII